MTYYFATKVDMRMDEAVAAVTAALARHGFGVLSDIDVQATMQLKLDAVMGGYRILGACNPKMAFQALQSESKIGTMLPCNVIVREAEDGQVEIAAIDPVASMQAVQNPELSSIAAEVQALLKAVIEEVGETASA